jgi:hypothetical protein
METAIEKRLEDLEKQVAELATLVKEPELGKDTWRSSVGMLPKDDISEEADRLGQEWRKMQDDS